MIEHFLPFPSICQKAAVTHCFSIFADIFFIKHICLWSKDAYSHFPPSAAGSATAKGKGVPEPRPRPARGHLEVVAAGVSAFSAGQAPAPSCCQAALSSRLLLRPLPASPPGHTGLHLHRHPRLHLSLRIYRELPGM